MSVTRRILLGAAAATAIFVLWLFAVWPPPVWYRTHFPRETAFMRMRGQMEGYRPVPLDSISRHFPRAVLVGEDHRFWTHHGIDFIEVRRALGYRRDGFAWTSPRDVTELVRALGGAWGRRDALRGASTISQQLAKNLYLSPSRNPLRKLKEAVTAYRLELALGKERVLELYVNVAELGDGVWGVEAASRKYFGRPAGALSRSEAAGVHPPADAGPPGRASGGRGAADSGGGGRQHRAADRGRRGGRGRRRSPCALSHSPRHAEIE